MANHKSALKRARQNVDRRMRNKATKTRIKNCVKNVRSAAAENQIDAAAKNLDEAQAIIDKAARKGVIHKNTAARKISRLTRLINNLTQ